MNKQIVYIISTYIVLSSSSSVNINAAGTTQENQIASKGALTEAAFIIHNKAYEIKNMYAQIKREFETAQLQDKRLEQEKTLLGAAVARHKKLLQETQGQKAQKQISQELEQSKTIFLIHMSSVHANKFMQKVYVELVRIGADCKNYVEEKSVELVDAHMPYKAVRAEVTKAQEIKKLLGAQRDCVYKALDLFQQETKVNIEKQRLQMVQKLISAGPVQAVRIQLLTEKTNLTRAITQAQKQTQYKRKQLITCRHTVRHLSTQLAQMGFEQIKNYQFLSTLDRSYRNNKKV